MKRILILLAVGTAIAAQAGSLTWTSTPPASVPSSTSYTVGASYWQSAVSYSSYITVGASLLKNGAVVTSGRTYYGLSGGACSFSYTTSDAGPQNVAYRVYGYSNRSGQYIAEVMLNAVTIVDAPPNAAPLQSLESASGNRGVLNCAGWAADNEDGAPVASVRVYIDNVYVGNATLQGDRPDVATAHSKPAWRYSGYSYTCFTSGYSPGEHVLRTEAYDSAGASTAESRPFTIKHAQSITFSNPGNQMLGHSLVLNAYASSGLPVSYTVVSGPATIAGNVVTFTAIGSVTLAAAQAGDASFDPAPPVNVQFVVLRDPTADDDSDGLPNEWEELHGLNPAVNDSMLDPDADGLTNVAEYNLGSDPQSKSSPVSVSLPPVYTTLSSGNPGRNQAVGETAGVFEVDPSGAARYSIPIWMVPGTAGMQPNLSLTYSSRAGNSIAGFGWDLSGVREITRLPATRAQDGFVDGINYNANDRFALDGSRLILVSGSYGADGAEYRTEVDSFSRIVSYGQSGSGPAYFRVWTRDGNVIDFGNPPDGLRADCTMEAANGAGIRTWFIRRATSSTGNYMEFLYAKDVGLGTHVLTRVDYTGNTSVSPALLTYASMRFTYEDRPDVSRHYAYGALAAVSKRLKAVSSYYGETCVRSYQIAYADLATRNTPLRSILSSITEVGSDGMAYPPTVFEYSNPENGWERSDEISARWTPPIRIGTSNRGYFSYQQNPATLWADLDGDGRSDLAYSFQYGTVPDPPQWGRASWLSGPGGWVEASGKAGQADYRIQSVLDSTYSYYSINNNPGRSAASQGSIAGPYPVQQMSGFRPPFADSNGDGIPEEFAPGLPQADYAWLPFSLGSHFGGYAYIASGMYGDGRPVGVATSDMFVTLIDLNADGLPDVLKDRAAYISGMSEAGSMSCLGQTEWDSPVSLRYGAELVDLNTDGLPDIITRGINPWYPDLNTNAAYLNTGVGWKLASEFQSPEVLYQQRDSSEPGQPTSTGTLVIDINNDGLPDIVRGFDAPGAQYRGVYFGTGTGWMGSSNAAFALAAPTILEAGAVYVYGSQLVDINADGAVDQVWNHDYANASKGVALNKRINPDRLSKIASGRGAVIEVTYAPLTQREIRDGVDSYTVYDRTTGAVYPMKDLPVPTLYVVKSVAHDTGIANADGSHVKYHLDYRYGGLREHALRGSVGFETLTVTDSRTDICTVTKNRQDFPFVGQPISINSYALDLESGGTGVQLSQTVNTWNSKSLNGGMTRFPFLERTESKTWDLGGIAMSRVQTEFQYDDWGNATVTTSKHLTPTGGEEGWGTRTVNQYDNTVRDPATRVGNSRWFVGLLTNSTTEASCPPQGESVPVQLTRTTSYSYYSSTGLLWKAIAEPDAAANADGRNLTLLTEFQYDGFGNKSSEVQSGGGMVARRSTTQYDTSGRFPTSVKAWKSESVAIGQSFVYNQALGVVASVTDANGLTTSWTYDGFGRKILEIRPSSNGANQDYTAINYRWCGGSAPLGSVYQIDTVVAGGTPALALYDCLGRATIAFTINGGDEDKGARMVGMRTWYDVRGRSYRTSLPFECESSIPLNPSDASYTEFDLLDRPTKVYVADDPSTGTLPVYRVTTINYAGRVTTTTDPMNRVTSIRKNSLGLVERSDRNATGTNLEERGRVRFLYDGFGQVRATRTLRSTDADDGLGVEITIGYDARGRKEWMVDPDAGTVLYGYDAVGGLIRQTNAKSQTVTFTADALGRSASRVEPEGVTSWQYDTSPNGIGKPAAVSFAPTDPTTHKAYSEALEYDSLGRPFKVTRTIGGTAYTQAQTYDDYSRPLVTTFPGPAQGVAGYRVKNVYDQLGFLREVRDARSAGSFSLFDVPAGYLYWKADGYSLKGAVKGYILGNGVTIDRELSEITSRTLAIVSGAGSASNIQELAYLYDAVGNVSQRQDAATGRYEAFRHDGLDRLTHAEVNGMSIDVTYDALGNLRSKTNAAAVYAYDSRPHAVSSLSGGPLGSRSFIYDGCGNLVSEYLTGALDPARQQTWTSYNQVKTIEAGGRKTEFWFGASQERVLQEDNDGTQTVYIGSAMEIVKKGDLTERKMYITTPAGRVAVRVERSDSLQVETRYFHHDALGSITAVTDEFGNLERRFEFDAWGQRTKPVDNRARTGGRTTRGYTDHEHLDDYRLVHMNGRVYDPVLSRFLSTDAFIQNPYDTETFNRYSYVQNNPLTRTDPSGWYTVTYNDDQKATVVWGSAAERSLYMQSSILRAGLQAKVNETCDSKNPGTDKNASTGSQTQPSDAPTRQESSSGGPQLQNGAGQQPVAPSSTVAEVSEHAKPNGVLVLRLNKYRLEKTENGSKLDGAGVAWQGYMKAYREALKPEDAARFKFQIASNENEAFAQLKWAKDNGYASIILSHGRADREGTDLKSFFNNPNNSADIFIGTMNRRAGYEIISHNTDITPWYSCNGVEGSVEVKARLPELIDAIDQRLSR